uniref:BEN domain-containing protein n=1 Tax=Macrostomum lignano TaxID=282301 RepID=A0A1I8I8M3_9PLAT
EIIWLVQFKLGKKQCALVNDVDILDEGVDLDDGYVRTVGQQVEVVLAKRNKQSAARHPATIIKGPFASMEQGRKFLKLCQSVESEADPPPTTSLPTNVDSCPECSRKDEQHKTWKTELMALHQECVELLKLLDNRADEVAALGESTSRLQEQLTEAMVYATQVRRRALLSVAAAIISAADADDKDCASESVAPLDVTCQLKSAGRSKSGCDRIYVPLSEEFLTQKVRAMDRASILTQIEQLKRCEDIDKLSKLCRSLLQFCIRTLFEKIELKDTSFTGRSSGENTQVVADHTRIDVIIKHLDNNGVKVSHAEIQRAYAACVDAIN